MNKKVSIAIDVVIVVVVAIAALLGYAATRSNKFAVQRTTTIYAAPEKIYPLVADFHRWSDWSPYEKLDPAMTRSFGGAPTGAGSMYQWQGNSKAGAGRMIMLKATPSSEVAIQLDFTKPLEGHNLAEFKFTPRGAGTDVVWSIQGWTPYLGKLMGIFFNVEAMIGRDFEAGLANLKAAAER
jgi:uncharacterized protein YndB with AHSA1/START domain